MSRLVLKRSRVFCYNKNEGGSPAALLCGPPAQNLREVKNTMDTTPNSRIPSVDPPTGKIIRVAVVAGLVTGVIGGFAFELLPAFIAVLVVIFVGLPAFVPLILLTTAMWPRLVAFLALAAGCLVAYGLLAIFEGH